MTESICTRLTHELGLRELQVERTITLLDEGNTIPFITRYRKEATGGLDEEQIRKLAERLEYLRNLEARRAEVRTTLEQGGHLTAELDTMLATAETLQSIEDIYLPFRPKRRTRAQIARENGLQDLAETLLAQKPMTQSREELATPFLSENIPDIEAAYAGARDIIAETITEMASVRQAIREATRRTSIVSATRKDNAVDEKLTYQLYYNFNQPLSALPPHRILALNRGEREGILKIAIEANHAAFIDTLQRRYVQISGWCGIELHEAIADGYKRLLAPAIERDLRNELTERAELHALSIFAANLRGLLLQPPLCGTVVMGIDPGYRTGCKVAVVDATGKYLEGCVIYLHQTEKAQADLLRLCQKWSVRIIAIGNGTASRETESLVGTVIRAATFPLQYTLVSEAGASVYSTSTVARDEFPELDATERGNISIARRLQDPLAELVKIDPKALGVGLYQHDVDQRQLASRLSDVVESVVNYVGVDLNTASSSLLTYVAGLNTKVARSIVAYRDDHGPFKTRLALRKVKGLGPKAFEQAAGFLRIPDSPNLLDHTAIHPESYAAAQALITLFSEVDSDPATNTLPHIAIRVRKVIDTNPSQLGHLAEQLQIGEPTLADIIEYMARPGRDPREGLSPPILREDVLTLEDLQPGMWLKGTVRNVVDFGAFVDIGVKQDGLIHISEMAGRFIKNPLEVVQVGDNVDVRVLSVDKERGRVALSMRSV